MDHETFLSRAALTPPAVVLGGLGVPIMTGIARDLGRLGIPVLAVHSTNSGSRVPSRFSANAVCPNPYDDPQGFVITLERIGRELPQKAILIPTRDDHMAPVAERLSSCYLLPFSVLTDMARINDKWQQIEGARRAGVDTPVTALVCSEEDIVPASSQVPFPAVLKPVTPDAGERHMDAKLLWLKDPAELPAAYEKAKACGPLLLQEFIPGAAIETPYLGSYLDAESRPLAIFTGRRLRQFPPEGGLTSIAESDVAEAGLRLLQEMGFHGVSHVEFKRDARDGRLKLMEVNARHYGTHTLATACGVNLTAVAYRDALGRPFRAPRQREGVKWVMATRDLVASPRLMVRGELTLREWLTSLPGVRVDGVLSFDDPIPGAAEVLRTAARVSRRSFEIATARVLGTASRRS
jgi:D-aspartate ligase